MVLEERTLPTIVTPMILRQGEVAHLRIAHDVLEQLQIREAVEDAPHVLTLHPR